MFALPVGGVLGQPSRLGDRLRQVLGQLADVAAGLLCTAEDALDVDLSAEPDHVRRLLQILRRLVEGRQQCAGVGVDEALRFAVPLRHPVPGVNLAVVVGPPHLVIRRGGDRAQLSPRDRAPDSGVEVRGAALLRLDRAEVLHLPADAAAGVLPEPIDQGREVDRVPSRRPVVVAVRVHRRPVRIHPPVGTEGECQKRRGLGRSDQRRRPSLHNVLRGSAQPLLLSTREDAADGHVAASAAAPRQWSRRGSPA